MPLIDVHDVHKVYGHRLSLVTAVAGISLAVAQGEFVGIMGPSGAGKTTLLNMMATIDRPTSGQIKIAGKDVTYLSERVLAKFRREQLGFIFQDFNLLAALTVRENIILPLTLAGLKVPVIEEALQKTVHLLGLTAILARYPDEISIGQKQRVACGRAIINQPQLLFADEPTGSLDSQAATELLRYLTTINQQLGTTIVLVTHDAFTASYCKRILFIKDGAIFSEIVRQGSRQAFFQQVIDMQATIGGGGNANGPFTTSI
ncbi:ABC transporter ATP-binding protein [Loigolactobacillus jiayinensis]|uniref:ABC transporter ATP-binding protein n=1 Tax=Loigolactobacillus jiayinensis TaxID=2486016 RepID=A0ABW1RFD7_9LACO|nr:ABC transporter ATP-binding protein [Loigolactobacillus jiayinensis]